MRHPRRVSDKYSLQFKVFIVDLFSKLRESGYGRARSFLCKFFDISLSTFSSWVSDARQHTSLLHRNDRYGGWNSPFVDAILLPAANREILLQQSPTVCSARQTSELVHRSGFGTRLRALQAVSLASQMHTITRRTDLPVALPDSLLQRSACSDIRPYLDSRFDGDFRSRCFRLLLPRSLADSQRLHLSRHSAVYFWQWPTTDAGRYGMAAYIIKVYRDRLPYLYEKAAFVMLTLGFNHGAVDKSLVRFFCFPVTELQYPLPDAGPTLNVSLIFEHFAAMTKSELRSCFRQGFSTVWVVFAQIITAVGALHAAGLSHCDIKPGNLLVRVAADIVTLKLIDFSCAQPLGSVGCRAGTAGYRALEVLGGSRSFKWSSAQDIFSCAVTMCSLVAGTHVIELPEQSTLNDERAAVRKFVADLEPSLLQFDSFGYWDAIDRPDFQRFCRIIGRMIGPSRISVTELSEMLR